MKRMNQFKIAGLSLVLLAAMGLYNCKPKETTPEIPDFETGYKDVKLPDLTQTTPAPVTTVPGSVTTSTVATSASSGLASGTVTAAVTSTATDIQKVVSPSDAGKLAAAFTPSVVTTMLSGGAMPASLSASMKSIASDPSLAAYLPKVTYPSVNGTIVTGLSKEIILPSSGDIPVVTALIKAATPSTKDVPFLTLRDYTVAGVTASPCIEAAYDAFEASKKTLNDNRTSQEKTVNDTYNSRVAGINSTSCKSAATAALTSAATAAKAKLDQQIAGLNTLLANKTITQDTYNLLSFFVYFDLYNSVVAATAFYTATVKSCDVATDTAKAAAKAVQTTDLARIKATYDATLAGMQTTLNNSFKTCHDQGQG